MANTIRIKRRPSTGSAGAPSSASLYNGELAFNENDNTLYYAYGSGVGGISTSVPAIAGSGAYSLRGGTNATGTWPISVNGNSASVTNGVYTTGNQTISGIKTFTDSIKIDGTNSSNVATMILKGSAGSLLGFDGDAPEIFMDRTGTNLSITNNYINSYIEVLSSTIKLDGTTQIKAANTTSNSVGYFAVFDSDPASSLTTLKSVSKDQILDDIGAATSGLILTAGSGLVGGGALSANRTFDIGQGDGITVSADSIAVNSTVVRTTTGGIANHIAYWNSSSGIVADSGQLYWDASNNSLGIGTSSPSGSLDVNGTVTFRSDSNTITNVFTEVGDYSFPHGAINWYNNYNNGGVIGNIASIHVSTDNSPSEGILSFSTRNNSSPSERMRILANGNVGIATTSPTEKLHVNGKGLFSSGVNISNQTANTIASFDDSKNVVSLSTSTYPSLTELSYVKGATSAIQTQLNNKIAKTSSTTIGNIPTWSVTTGDALGTGYSVETTLTGGSSSLPRADAVKTYVDSMIGSGIATNDAMIFKGAIDCSTNPNYPAADRGWTYKVSVAGKIGGASGPAVEVNDTLICTTDSTSAGTHAAVGSNWVILQTNIADASILVTGPTSATSGNIAIFDGTTGKIIKDAGFAATTVGQNLVSLTNPSATTFIKVNSNNTVSTESASTFRTSLGANTVGSNIFTLTNPSAISFLRINADNTVTARSASDFKTDLSLNNVENTALSTWAGSSNITTLGTITTGTWNATTIAVNRGGTGQTSYTDGQLLIGNSTGNTLTKATLTQGTAIDITNGGGSITIGHNDTSTLTGAQGSNGIASFTVDGMGHVTAVTTATYLTSGQSLCDAISNSNCTIDGGTF